MMEFYHNKGIDLLKLGCTLSNLANICLHKSTKTSVFTSQQTVVDQIYIRNSENICKTIVSIDARQIYSFSMSQEMPTGLHTQLELDTSSQKFKARTKKSRTFENMVMSYFQSKRPECTIENCYKTGKQKKIDCFSVDGFCAHCDTVF